MAIVNDVVLIYLENEPVSFARIESILPDAKKDWYHIKLLMLQIPLQAVTWILKEDYINGQAFHMNGKEMKLVNVECPMEEQPFSKPASSPAKSKGQKTAENEGLENTEPSLDAKIISFPGLKKKNHDPESG